MQGQGFSSWQRKETESLAMIRVDRHVNAISKFYIPHFLYTTSLIATTACHPVYEGFIQTEAGSLG